MENDEVNVNTAAPLDIHPGIFEHIEGVNDDTRKFVEPAIAAFQAAVDALGAVRDVRDAAASNPTLNEAARILKTADFADRKVAEVLTKIQGAHEMLKKQMAFVEEELNKPLELNVHSNTAAELRSLVRAMSPAERRKLMVDSIAANDMTVLGSILSAHPLLSGLTPLERTEYTRRYRVMSQPQIAQRLAVMQKAFDLIGERGGLVMTQAEKLIGADRGKLNSLRAAEAKFSKALAK